MLFEADLEAARARIADAVVRTPVWRSDELDEALGCSVWLKCEPLQRTGSFKLRGATNAIRSLPAGARGVVAVSSGNHAQAVACAGRSAGLPVTVVMNADANPSKRAATRAHGATVVSEGVDPTNREEIARALAEREGLAFVHPFDDWDVIAGQGTATLELLEEVPGLDAVITPVGGGGLLSGAALACRARRSGDQRLRRRARGLARRAALARRRAARAAGLPAHDDRGRRPHGADRGAHVRRAERALRRHLPRRRRRGAARPGTRVADDAAPDRADLGAADRGHRGRRGAS